MKLEEVRKSLQDIAAMVDKRPCLQLRIPPELQPYHYYTLDGGHCIVCVPVCFLGEARARGMDDYEVPVPAKYVLEKGYRIEGGYIIVDVPYDSTFGVTVPDKYSLF